MYPFCVGNVDVNWTLQSVHGLGYGTNDRTNVVRFPEGVRSFPFFESVQTAPGTQRTSHSLVSGAFFFPRAQNGRTAKGKSTHLHAVPRLRIRPHVPPSPPPMSTQTILLYMFKSIKICSWSHMRQKIVCPPSTIIAFRHIAHLTRMLSWTLARKDFKGKIRNPHSLIFPAAWFETGASALQLVSTLERGLMNQIYRCRTPMAKAAFNKKRALFPAHWTWNWGRRLWSATFGA